MHRLRSIEDMLRAFLLAALLASSSISAQEPASTGDTKPLPDLATLLTRAREHSDNSQELAKTYTCKMMVVGDELDSKGNKKGSHSDEYQVFFVNKVEVHQHVAHDGKPLSDSDAKKEQERIDKLTEEIKANKVKSQGGTTIRISSLLKQAKAGPPIRDMVNGRPALRFDYSGDPNAKATDLPEEVMKKLTGTVWIDEQEETIVKITGRLMENFKVGGGLVVNIKSGSSFELETERIHNEVWFTTHLIVHGDGRLLLLKGFDFNQEITFSDYRKMKTTVTLEPGSQVIDENGNPVPNPGGEPSPAQPASPKPVPKP
jgi:hypothetical protein